MAHGWCLQIGSIIGKGKNMLDGKSLTWMLVGVAVGYFVLAKYLGK
jgi:hypothetical protein